MSIRIEVKGWVPDEVGEDSVAMLSENDLADIKNILKRAIFAGRDMSGVTRQKLVRVSYEISVEDVKGEGK